MARKHCVFGLNVASAHLQFSNGPHLAFTDFISATDLPHIWPDVRCVLAFGSHLDDMFASSLSEAGSGKSSPG